MRSPGFYVRKARDRIFGNDISFYERDREAYPTGSFEWLALKEKLYGGLQLTKIHRGGDRMSPCHHNYARCYATFLRPFVEVAASKRLTVAEIGILKGTRLPIWCDLFPNARVVCMDIDLFNFQENRKNFEKLGAFQTNAPESCRFDQFDSATAAGVRIDVFGESRINIAIEDGCHSIESIEITFEALRPFLAETICLFH